MTEEFVKLKGKLPKPRQEMTVQYPNSRLWKIANLKRASMELYISLGFDVL